VTRKLLIPAFLLFLAGCATAPKPPAFNLYERVRLAVFPFANSTVDPVLAGAVRDGVLAGLHGLNAVPVEKASGEEGDPEKDPGARKRLADSLKCDVVMTGSVTAYAEDVVREEPKRIRSSYRRNEYKWGYGDTGGVKLGVTVSLVDVSTGKVLWTRKTEAESHVSRWVDLPWPGEKTDPPVGGWDTMRAENAGETRPDTKAPVYPNDRNVSRAREIAIAQAVRDIIEDFTGRGGWQPVRPTASRP
jgi:TolB-like protein